MTLTPEQADALAQKIADNLRAGGSTVHRPIPFSHGVREAKQPSAAPALIRSRGEQPYSLVKLMRALGERDLSLAPYEVSLSRKLETCGYTVGVGGVLIPLGDEVMYRTPGHEAEVEVIAAEVKQSFPIAGAVDAAEISALQRKYFGKAMDSADDTLGGSLIPIMQGELITALRAAEVFSRAGAQTVPIIGPTPFPRETGDPVFSWLGANENIPDSESATGQLLLSPKAMKGLVKIPNELARYATGVAEVLVRRALVERAARTLDLALLEGTGGGKVPLGLINYPRSANNAPTADKITLHNAGTTGAAGDTFMPKDVLTMLSLIEEAPDPDGASAWVMRPLMFNGIANARADAVSAADGAGPFLFPVTRGAMANEVQKVLAGIPVLTSTTVANKRTKGASGETLSYVLAGNFRRYLIGRVGTLEIGQSEHAGFANDQIWIRAVMRVDGAPTHPHAFCVSDQLVIPS